MRGAATKIVAAEDTIYGKNIDLSSVPFHPLCGTSETSGTEKIGQNCRLVLFRSVE